MTKSYTVPATPSSLRATWEPVRVLGYTELSPAGRTAAAVPRTESVVIRIGINGLGRIGRGFLRLALERDDLRVVAVNDLAEPAILAHLLCHDSLAGRLDVEVGAQDGALFARPPAIRAPSMSCWRRRAASPRGRRRRAI